MTGCMAGAPKTARSRKTVREEHLSVAAAVPVGVGSPMRCQLRQNSGRNNTSTVNSSNRPNSMAKARTHFAVEGSNE